MGGALCAGWQRKGFAEILVCDPHPSSLKVEQVPFCTEERVREFDAEIVVLAVKPQNLGDVLPGLRGLSGIFLSIVAGATTRSLGEALGVEVVVRAMPNTPAALGYGVSVMFAPQEVPAAQREACERLMEAVGEVYWIQDESLFGAITALSGCGPAYVFYLTECMAQAGAALGLEREFAAALARGTVCGAGQLLGESPQGPSALRRNVTSPGGVTEAALKVLMPSVEKLMTEAFLAAQERAQALAYEAGKRK